MFIGHVILLTIMNIIITIHNTDTCSIFKILILDSYCSILCTRSIISYIDSEVFIIYVVGMCVRVHRVS